MTDYKILVEDIDLVKIYRHIDNELNHIGYYVSEQILNKDSARYAFDDLQNENQWGLQ